MVAKTGIQPISELTLKQKYDVGPELGAGTFSIVREATDKETGEKIAIKVMDKRNVEFNEKFLEQEVNILRAIQHPNIVKLHAVYETPKKVYIAMELLQGGEMFNHIVTHHPNGYTEEVAATVMKQLLSAMKNLHDHGIVHRDLKPENLIYSTPPSANQAPVLKVTDFGLAKMMTGDAMLKTACGTPYYVAPEVLKKNGYGKEVDLWSCGVIMYILLCGFPPFFNDNIADLFQTIQKGQFTFPSPYWDGVSDAAKDLVTGLLCVDPTKRYTVEAALGHPWLKLAKGAAECHSNATQPTMKSLPTTVVSRMKENKGRLRSTVERVTATYRILQDVFGVQS